MIGSSENRISYNGNGIATEFAYNFIIIEKSDIKVLHVAADGTEQLLTKDYYVDMEKSVVLYPGYAPGAERIDHLYFLLASGLLSIGKYL